MLGNIQLGSYQLGSAGSVPPSLDQSISSTLALTQTAKRVRFLSASNTLTLTGIGVRSRSFPASNTLAFTESATTSYAKVRRGFSDLLLTQTANRQYIHRESVVSTLSLTETVKRVILVTASNTLVLSQTDSETNAKNVNQTLLIAQAMSVQKVINRTVIQTVPIIHVTALNKKIQVSSNSVLALAQQDDRIRSTVHAASNTLTMTCEAVRLKILRAVSSLVGLSQAVSFKRVLNRTVANSLNLTETVARNVKYGRSVSNTLPFFPFRVKKIRIGELTEVNIPNLLFSNVSGTMGQCTESEFKAMTFQSGGQIIVMPRPLIGDREGNTTIFSLSNSMTGVQRTVVKRSQTKVFSWDFDVRYTKFLELSDFLFDLNAKAFLINDFKGRAWIGKLLSNPITFTDYLEPEDCHSKFTVTLDFEALRLH